MSVFVIILPLIYTVVFVCAVLGNTLFITAVYRNTKLHSSVFVFLANQSISDLLFINFTLFSVVEFVMGSWELGDIFCRIMGILYYRFSFHL